MKIEYHFQTKYHYSHIKTNLIPYYFNLIKFEVNVGLF